MNKNILYLDCFSGISGDMFVGAMLDLGIDSNFLVEQLNTLPINNFKVEISKKVKNGIYGTDFNVIIIDKNREKHHRNIIDIFEIIDNSKINEKAKEISKSIFNILALSEAKVHNIDINQVHFHEIGALDSIIDIVSASICINELNIDLAYCSKINAGSGVVQTMHGVLPVPAPATADILRGFEIYFSNITTELTTPTGAAILKYLVGEYKNTKFSFIIRNIGYGFGKKELNSPNFLRVINGEIKNENDSIYIIETNIDNLNSEIYTYLFPKLFEIGALDVYITPIFMKKNRPAYKVSVLCYENLIDKIEYILFSETTTIGVRKYKVERTELERKIEKIVTKYGEVSIKISFYKNEILNISPEYDDCEKIAKNFNIPVKKVIDEIKILSYNKFSK